MDKVIFFHMNQLGDLLFSLPVLKAAKKQGSVKVISVVSSSLSPLLTSSGLADEIIPKNMPLLRLIRNVKKEKAGKAVLFSESPGSLFAAYLSKITERIGFESASFSFLLTKKAERKGVPSPANNIALGRRAGFENIQKDYTGILKIPGKNMLDARKWFEKNNLDPAKTAAISSGASKKRMNKCLSANKWAEIIDLLDKAGLCCVLAGAPWEKAGMNEIALKCAKRPAVFCAEGGILESAAFFSLSSLFIGTDSGAMHLAAAVGTKCAAIFGPTDPFQIGPMPLEKHIIIKKDKISAVTARDIISRI